MHQCRDGKCCAAILLSVNTCQMYVHHISVHAIYYIASHYSLESGWTARVELCEESCFVLFEPGSRLLPTELKTILQLGRTFCDFSWVDILGNVRLQTEDWIALYSTKCETKHQIVSSDAPVMQNQRGLIREISWHIKTQRNRLSVSQISNPPKGAATQTAAKKCRALTCSVCAYHWGSQK